ncbi:LLM class flavin-dependent oxidoreductase [Spirillospora sp. NPDC047279]|uniref:LLM class flavin-dependent oxidoreductase n=1 Tax=Spirillospora sp. NPDC047279 TaxID=3155478 RepID=UPI0033F724E2
MRITYGPWGETLGELIDAAGRAEAAGAEVVWVPELHRSATVAAAALAMGTRRARIGTAITLAFTRSPMITALEALDLDELSGGRFVLGLGTGVKRLNEDWHNVRWAPPAPRLRETVAAIRLIVARAADGVPLVLDGAHAPLNVRGYRRPFPQVRESVPVYLAGLGPGLTRLAGEIGDGWISHELCSPAWLRDRSLPMLEQGLDAAGRDRAGLDVVVSAVCSIDPDPAAARARAANVTSFYASVRTYAGFFAFHGLAGAAPEAMADVLTLAGTAAQVRERLAGYEGLADTVKLTPPTHGLPPHEIRAAQARLIELIGEVAC